MEDLNFNEDDMREPVRSRSHYTKPEVKDGDNNGKRSRPSKWRDIELLNEQRQLQRQLQDLYF